MLENVGLPYLEEGEGDLLGCPVCGTKNLVTMVEDFDIRWRAVVCDKCGLVMDGYSEEGLAYKWNRRAGWVELVKRMRGMAPNSTRLKHWMEALAVISGLEVKSVEFARLVGICSMEERVYDEHLGEVVGDGEFGLGEDGEIVDDTVAGGSEGVVEAAGDEESAGGDDHVEGRVGAAGGEE